MRLIIEDDEGRKTVVPITETAVTIGRQDGNTVLLKDRNVSRKHASMVRQNGSVLIEDLNSFNGVRINGDRIQGKTQVHEGDLIQIGDYDLAIEREAVEPTSDRKTEPLLGAVRALGYPIDEETPRTHDEERATRPTPPRTHSHTALIKSPYGTGGELNFDGVPVPTSEQPRLVVLNTSERGRELAISKTVMSIGRAGGPADLTIDHRSISKLHGKIAIDDSGVWHITDLKSANGLRINSEDYGESPLNRGDVLELGHVQLKFLMPGEKYALKPQPQVRRRRIIGASVLGAALVAVAGLFTFSHPHSNRPEAAGGTSTVRTAASPQAPSTGPVAQPPPAPPSATVAVVVPPAESPEDDIDRASQAVQQVKGFIHSREWDKADQKLKEAEDVDPEDRQVARLRHQIDAALARETNGSRDAREAPKESAKPPRADRHVRSRPSDSPPQETEAPAPAASAPPLSRADRKTKVKAIYEEAIKSIGGQDFVAAIPNLEHVVEIDPSNAEAQKALGICYAKLHQPDKGAYHYEQYLKLNPHARDADDVRKMLQDYYKQKGE